MDLIFMRHGQTYGNINRIFSTPETRLTELGKSQARERHNDILNYNFKQILVSPYIRCQETLAETGIEDDYPVIEEPLVREINLGILEGNTFDDAYHKYGKILDPWINNPIVNAPPKGESINDGVKRAGQFLNKIQKSSLIVCHDGIIRLCLCYILENAEAFFKFKMKNASLTYVEKQEDRFIIKSVNC